MIRHIRTTLGFTQEDMAIYLMVPHSVISMTESGLRELPFNKLKKLTELYMICQQHEQEKVSGKVFKKQEVLAQNNDFHEKKIHRVSTLQHNLVLLKDELAAMEVHYQSMSDKAIVMENMRKSFEGIETEENRLDRSWLDLQWTKAISEIRKCGPDQQINLRIKIELAEAEIAITHRLLESLNIF
jgi:transcriptional regulator with XRE-family HTH domain